LARSFFFDSKPKLPRMLLKTATSVFFTHWAGDYVELVDGGGIVPVTTHATGPWPQGASLPGTPIHAEMAASGDPGHVYGTGRFAVKDKESKTEVDYGEYTMIGKKRNDGQCKVAASIGNSSPSPKTDP
jgi:hypothetical protein